MNLSLTQTTSPRFLTLLQAKQTLWIGTADIKDLYVVQGKMEKPFLGVLSDLIGKGVEVRLIHAKEPGPNFREDFDRYPRLATMLERVMCPRVHFKIIVIDQSVCYVGSANLTGAGMGMKSDTRRNFFSGGAYHRHTLFLSLHPKLKDVSYGSKENEKGSALPHGESGRNAGRL